jgi:hypothetical protein
LPKINIDFKAFARRLQEAKSETEIPQLGAAARIIGGWDFDPSATLPANFEISTNLRHPPFFTSGSFFLNHCLAPCSRMVFHGLPWFFAQVFPWLPVALRLRFGLS